MQNIEQLSASVYIHRHCRRDLQGSHSVQISSWHVHAMHKPWWDTTSNLLRLRQGMCTWDT